MPYRVQRANKRKGRSRRSGRQLLQSHPSNDVLQQQGPLDRKATSHLAGQVRSLSSELHQSLTSSTVSANNSKPREERSYKDFYPSLDIKQPLSLIRRTDTVPLPTKEPTSSPPTPPTPPSTNELTTLTADTATADTATADTATADTATADTATADTATSVTTPPLPQSNSSKSSLSPDSNHAIDGSYRPFGELDDVSDASKEATSDDTTTNSTPIPMLDATSDGTPTQVTLPSNPFDTSTSIETTTPSPSVDSPVTESAALWKDHPIMIRGSRKEGDIYQALSTRSQPHHTTASGAVDVSALPKPCFEKVVDDMNGSSINKKRKRMAQKLKSAVSKTRGQTKKRNDEEQGSDVVGTTRLGDTDTNDSTNSDTDDDNDDDDDDGDDADADGYPVAHYSRPENHYIRYIEPTEESLFDTVEYDMDEQDEAWLQMLNAERKKESLGEVSCAFFETVIDKLEKEWFDLVKHLPKRADAEPILPEDSACSICDDGECENSNAIVFCDGCNLAVHQDCYGVPYIPEGQWLCRKCMVSPDKPVSCLFCPNEGGAFKQTNTNKWGHLLCAIWIPEVGVSNSVYMEPIDNIDSIPKSRWKLTCYLCKKRHGACIQCDNKHCFTAFHVTCARWARLCMRMKSHGTHYDSVLLKAYCDRHTPRDYRDEVDVEKCVLTAQEFLDPKSPKNRGRSSSSCTPRRRYVDTIRDLDMKGDSDNGHDDEDQFDGYDSTSDAENLTTKKQARNSKSNKRLKTDGGYKKQAQQQQKGRRQAITVTQQLTPSIKAAMAHQHHYSAGAPIAPDYILTRLENTKCVRNASMLRKRGQLVSSICRYWSLKRESRRGAPLLKRLHLEPWTASSSQLKQTEREKLHRASAMMKLRSDLEHVRMLSEQVQKREKQKLERMRRQKEYIEMVLFPIEYIIRPVLNQLMELDKKEYFLYPVTPDVAPDYHEIIDNPMAFSDIIEKFHAHKYTTLDAVEFDLSLIWTNSKTYNKADTSYYKVAQRLEEEAADLMLKARQKYGELAVSDHAGTLALGIDPDIFSYDLVTIAPPTADGDGTLLNENLIPSEHHGPSEMKRGVATSTRHSTVGQTPKTTTTRPARTKLMNAPSQPARATRSSSTVTTHISLPDKLSKSRKLRKLTSTKKSTPSAKITAESRIVKGEAAISNQGEQLNEVQHPLNISTTSNESPHHLATTSSHMEQPTDESLNTVSAPSTTISLKQEPALPSFADISPSPASPASSTPSSKSSGSSTSSSTRTDQLKGESSTTRRRTRSAGSDGLIIPTRSQMKYKKMSSELRKLVMTDTMPSPVPYEETSYKKSKTKHAPTGYVYISTDEEDNDDDEEAYSSTDADEDQSTRSTGRATLPESELADDDGSTTKYPRPASSSSSSRKSKRRTRRTKKKAPTKLLKPLKELNTTTPGEIVWAKVPSFPFHPAKIVDLKKNPVSKNITKNSKEKSILVKFYKVPEAHQWGWVRPVDIYKFGNEENDLIMLEQAKLIRTKKKLRYQEVMDGYKYVCQQYDYNFQRI